MVKISENEKQLAFGLLALLAIGAAIYVFVLAEPPDTPSDIAGFYRALAASNKTALFFDVRGTDSEGARMLYQCGVDIIGVGPREIATYVCDAAGCTSASTASNGTNTLTLEQVRRSLRGTPYVKISYGAPSTKYFTNHMEITLDKSFNSSCRFG